MRNVSVELRQNSKFKRQFWDRLLRVYSEGNIPVIIHWGKWIKLEVGTLNNCFLGNAQKTRYWWGIADLQDEMSLVTLMLLVDISDGYSPLLSCWSEICLDFSNYEAKISHLIVPCTFLLFMFRIYCMMAWRIHGSSFPVVPTGNLEMRIDSLKLGKSFRGHRAT